MQYFWMVMAAVGVVTTMFVIFTVLLLWASKKLARRQAATKKFERESWGVSKKSSFWGKDE